MNYKRAIGIGIVAYLVSFVIGISIAVVVGVDFETATEAPTIVWIIGLIAQLIVGLLFAWWYFSAKKIKKYGPKQGFLLGTVFVAVGFIIDAFFIIPSIILTEGATDILKYYTNPLFWVSILLLLLSTMFVGSCYDDKNKK
jgi:peptidoglycan/LPS O-acetylase OafA/YrhL